MTLGNQGLHDPVSSRTADANRQRNFGDAGRNVGFGDSLENRKRLLKALDHAAVVFAVADGRLCLAHHICPVVHNTDSWFTKLWLLGPSMKILSGQCDRQIVARSNPACHYVAAK